MPAKTKLSFLQHIEECEHCEAYLQGYRKTIDISKAAFVESEPAEKNKMPEELMDAILAASQKSWKYFYLSALIFKHLHHLCDDLVLNYLAKYHKK